jgi:hypothetical protein
MRNMSMYVVKSFGTYLHEGVYDKSLEFYCPYFGDLLDARMFESKEQLYDWLTKHTNLQPRRLNKQFPRWTLVPYNEEAATLITKLIQRMA